MNKFMSVLLPMLTAFGICFAKWDGIVAVGVVAFTEIVIKRICKKVKPEVWDNIVKICPIFLSVIVYIVMSIVTKDGQITNAIIKGLVLGLATEKSYDTLFKIAIEWIKSLAGINKKAIEDLDEKAREELDKAENKK